MKTDLEVEVEVDLRPLGKVIIFCDRQTELPIIYIYILSVPENYEIFIIFFEFSCNELVPVPEKYS